MNKPHFVPPASIRAEFSKAMSAMYRAEVPLYGALLDIVAKVNGETLERDPALRACYERTGEIGRLNEERHGAVRVGTAGELAGLRALFAVMDMHAVGYYDLSVAGLPVHSTAFRPVEPAALKANAFRIFCSLLRLDLIENGDLRETARATLAKRQIFRPGVLALIEKHARDGGLNEGDARSFVAEALETFRWHGDALVDQATYEHLNAAHSLVADIVCFRGPHINHLTPRTLDIDAAQAEMRARGIKAKAVIEGPPLRKTPILLRQTSFAALEEPVRFGDSEARVAGAHRARFGEIEQRGVALTPAGRARYDAALASIGGAGGANHGDRLARAFADFPDDAESLRTAGLAYFTYRLSADGVARKAAGTLPTTSQVDALIAAGLLVAEPITYEDFLPVSAAGIFRSNLGAEKQPEFHAKAAQAAFEQALGASIIDPFALYAAQQASSLRDAVSTR